MEESKTPETDKCVKDNKHIKFLQESNWIDGSMITIENPIVGLCRRLEKERDEARKLAEQFRALYNTQLGIKVNSTQFPWEETK